MKFHADNIDRIEHHINPTMREVITIPVGDPLDGLAIYVASKSRGWLAAPSQAKELRKIALLIVASQDLLELVKYVRTYAYLADLGDDTVKRLDDAIAKVEGQS